MPILRAGPFANSENSFLDEPVTANGLIVPVNCAKDASSISWPWRYYKVITKTDSAEIKSYESGLVSESDSISFGEAEAASLSIMVIFRYQAAQEFTMSLAYSASVSSTGGFGVTNSEISISGTTPTFFDQDESDLGDEGISSISGSTLLTFPASVVPRYISMNISAGCSSDGLAFNDVSLDVSFSLSS